MDMMIKTKQIVFMLVLLAVVNSCGMINEDLPECIQSLRFVYDKNMLGADAFSAQVESVDLYVFDQNGDFVQKISDSGDALQSGDYRMNLNLADGVYKVYAWCGMKDNGFTLSSTDKPEEMAASITALDDGVSSKDLHSLWYGCQEITIDHNKMSTQTVNLTKDTNNILVMLQHADGSPVNGDDFIFTIEDENVRLDSKNNPSGHLTYQAFSQGTRQVGGDETSEPVKVAYAEFSTSRLFVGNNTRLTVVNKLNGQIVLDIPLLDYLVMRSEKYASWSNQEYLDRECDYSLVLFLGRNEQWLKTTIIVNGWTIRINDI